MASNIFRIFRPDGPKEDRVQKRRAQLRQAQQTYRDRKDKYTKALESEIARLRASEDSLLREVQCLTNTTQILLQALHQRGVHDLDEVCRSIETTRFLGVNPTLSDPMSSRRQVQQLKPLEIEAAAIDAGTKHYPKLQQADHLSYPPVGGAILDAGPSLERQVVRMSDLDPIEVGTEFILVLEKPCLSHLHGDPDKPDEPTGHTLMVSAHLSSASTSSAVNMVSPIHSGSIQRHTAATMLDSLLGLSSELCSDQEITPVQAWNYIRSQPQFGGLEAGTLRKLAETLRDTVTCHGFGAAVERSVFESLVSETLLVGRPF